MNTSNTKHEKYLRLIDFCKSIPPTPTAVVHPCDQSSLEGAVEAGQIGLIAPILVGHRARIDEAAGASGIDISPYPIVDVPFSQAAAAAAVMGANARGEPRISAPSSRMPLWVIPTNEELMIARHTRSVIGTETL